MSNKKLTAAAPLAALCAAMAFAVPPAAAEQPGMVVVRDPQTGQLRAPTPAELKALHTRGSASMNASAAEAAPAAVARKDGVRQVRLGEKSMVYSVVTRDADGKLAEHCVQGEHAMKQAVSQPAAAAKHTEHNHD